MAIAVQRRGKVLGGRLSYLVEAARAIIRARPRSVELVVDGRPEPPAPYHLVVVANTSTFGGGMRVAPGADPADGWLDLVTVGAVSRGELLRLLARARTGGHVGRPGVALRQARRVEAAGDGRGPLNVDGEAWGELPATLNVLPGALRWIARPQVGAGIRGYRRSPGRIIGLSKAMLSLNRKKETRGES